MENTYLPNQNSVIETLRKNQIEFAALFGSRAKNEAREDSDYDLLIEFSPDARVGIFKYQAIEAEIAQALGKKVDLVTTTGIDKHIKNEVFDTMKVIYDTRSKR